MRPAYLSTLLPWLAICHSATAQYVVQTTGDPATYATITAALSALGSNPGTLWLPAGTTSISSPIQLTTHQRLIGHGKYISILQSSDNDTPVIEIIVQRDVIIQGLEITHSVMAVSGGDGIKINYDNGNASTFAHEIKNCNIHDNYYGIHGICDATSAGIYVLEIYDNTISDNKGWGIYGEAEEDGLAAILLLGTPHDVHVPLAIALHLGARGP